MQKTPALQSPADAAHLLVLQAPAIRQLHGPVLLRVGNLLGDVDHAQTHEDHAHEVVQRREQHAHCVILARALQRQRPADGPAHTRALVDGHVGGEAVVERVEERADQDPHEPRQDGRVLPPEEALEVEQLPHLHAAHVSLLHTERLGE
jgi:hypothetical protein